MNVSNNRQTYILPNKAFAYKKSHDRFIEMAAAPKWLVTLHRFAVLYFARFLCTIFRGKGLSVRPTATNQNAILKCSATELARKIRRQEVSYLYD